MIRLWCRIDAKLTLSVLSCVAMILGASLALYHQQARALLLMRLEESARNRSLAVLQQVKRVLIPVQRATQTLARDIASTAVDQPSDVVAFLQRGVEMNPEMFGMSMAFEPDVLGHPERRYAPFVFRSGHDIRIIELPEFYDYVFADWYQIPRELGQAEWSEPYYELGAGNTRLISTFSVPVNKVSPEGAHFIGILTADIELDWLTRELAELKVFRHGFAVLVSRHGTILSHPQADFIMNESLFSLADAGGGGELRDTARMLISGDADFVYVPRLFGVAAHVYHAPVATTGWTLAIVFPTSDLFDDINRLTLNAALFGIFGLLLSLPVVLLIAHSISRPLRRLAVASGQIAGGDFDLPLPQSRRCDEVGGLTRAFATMTASLARHIEQLRLTTMAKERIESELAIARDMQRTILPSGDHARIERPELQLRTAIVPAREVGGDFFDLFLLKTNLLCILVADVSGKGVPAALYMAVAKTLIKTIMQSAHDVAETLTLANAELATDNDTNMFVTVFMGVLDLRSGELCYTNAGHNPPLLLASMTGDAPRFLHTAPQLMLGVLPGTCYRVDHLHLNAGDRLLLYTDGVTEAMDVHGELYGDARLVTVLERTRNASLDRLIAELLGEIRGFTDATELSDDLTLLALDYVGDQGGD